MSIMKKIALLLIVISTSLISCKKDDGYCWVCTKKNGFDKKMKKSSCESDKETRDLRKSTYEIEDWSCKNSLNDKQ